ncbi:MAG: DNA gyrase subunit A, partial [Janthinobacterium lividum]
DVTTRRTQFRRTKAADRLHLVQGMLLAIIDIDDVIAIVRSSDDAAEAKTRLIEAFDLSDVQATYILDMPLRRLTRLSLLELETERDALLARIAALSEILDSPDRLRSLVSDELADVAKTHGTPRRTILLAAGGTAATTTAAPLEVADDPCWVLMSSAGLLARTGHVETLSSEGPRSNHDVVVARVLTTARADVGLLTSRGRCVRLNALDLPTVPATASAPNLQGGTHVSELVTLGAGERALGLTTLRADGPGLALGTAAGVVKRVAPEVLNRDAWEVIRLDDADEVVGAVELTPAQAAAGPGGADLVFVTGDAQLLHFPAASVRPQGRGGGGMSGVRLAPKTSAVWFGVTDPTDGVVVTVAGSASALPGTDPGTVKVTALTEYPAKGRATGGVRCHRFLKGEDTLLLAWVGPAPAVAAAASGAPVELPSADGRRDGSGVPAGQPIAAVAGRSTG